MTCNHSGDKLLALGPPRIAQNPSTRTVSKCLLCLMPVILALLGTLVLAGSAHAIGPITEQAPEAAPTPSPITEQAPEAAPTPSPSPITEQAPENAPSPRPITYQDPKNATTP